MLCKYWNLKKDGFSQHNGRHLRNHHFPSFQMSYDMSLGAAEGFQRPVIVQRRCTEGRTLSSCATPREHTVQWRYTEGAYCLTALHQGGTLPNGAALSLSLTTTPSDWTMLDSLCSAHFQKLCITKNCNRRLGVVAFTIYFQWSFLPACTIIVALMLATGSCTVYTPRQQWAILHCGQKSR